MPKDAANMATSQATVTPVVTRDVWPSLWQHAHSTSPDMYMYVNRHKDKVRTRVVVVSCINYDICP